uniref:Odorant-binding protein 1 n=1 Tax=Cryptolaemus montrouzieri TaxID=559131 RepID=A0A0U4C436_9CUCU|nr:odorant-binding protein 1 [Cryptolaemus montrouzieri]
MKSITLTLAFIVISLCGVMGNELQEMFARIQTYNAECGKEINVDSDVLSRAKKGDIDEKNENLSAYILCYAKKVGFVNDAVELQDDVIARKMSLQVTDKALVTRVVKLCHEIKNTGDNNLFSSRVLSCYYKNLPGVIIM